MHVGCRSYVAPVCADRKRGAATPLALQLPAFVVGVGGEGLQHHSPCSWTSFLIFSTTYRIHTLVYFPQVLWTPEEEDDYFTVTDLAMDYPLLNTL